MATKLKYKVLSTSQRRKRPTAFIVEAKNLTKNQAIKVAKREGGWYCGASENSSHKKFRGRKLPKSKHCYKVKAFVKRM